MALWEQAVEHTSQATHAVGTLAPEASTSEIGVYVPPEGEIPMLGTSHLDLGGDFSPMGSGTGSLLSAPSYWLSLKLLPIFPRTVILTW